MAYEFLQEITESSQFRTKSRVDGMNPQQIKDFAFTDLNSLYVMYNEPQYRDYAMKYARETMQSRNFDRPRVVSTDLYNAIYHSNQDKKINQANIRRYLEGMSTGRLTDQQARSMLLKLENEFGIQDTRLKSMRRQTQGYNQLNASAKRNLFQRINQSYKNNGRYGQLYSTIGMLGSAGYAAPAPEIPQKKSSVAGTLATLGGLAAAGYYLGKKGT